MIAHVLRCCHSPRPPCDGMETNVCRQYLNAMQHNTTHMPMILLRFGGLLSGLEHHVQASHGVIQTAKLLESSQGFAQRSASQPAGKLARGAAVHKQLLGQEAHAEQYLRLLCQFDPPAVLPFLQSHDSYQCDLLTFLCLLRSKAAGTVMLMSHRVSATRPACRRMCMVCLIDVHCKQGGAVHCVVPPVRHPRRGGVPAGALSGRLRSGDAAARHQHRRVSLRKALAQGLRYPWHRRAYATVTVAVCDAHTLRGIYAGATRGSSMRCLRGRCS